MFGFKDLKVSTKLALITVITALGFVAFGAIVYSMVNTVKVGGPIYLELEVVKDLKADEVKPSLYLSEARMDILALVEETDSSKLQPDIDKFTEAKKAFEDAHSKYLHDLPDGRLKELLNGECYTEGREWVRIVESDIIPSRLRRDDKAVIAGLARGRSHFFAHQKAASTFAQAIDEEDQKLESAAASTTKTRMIVLLLMGLGIVGIILFSLYVPPV